MECCRRCKFFRFHLSRNTAVGLCSQWIQTEFSNGTCDWFKPREYPKVKYNPKSKNGKTFFEWTALNKGFDCNTGNPLDYAQIKAIANKYGWPLSDIQKFKKNKVKQLELI